MCSNDFEWGESSIAGSFKETALSCLYDKIPLALELGKTGLGSLRERLLTESRGNLKRCDWDRPAIDSGNTLKKREKHLKSVEPKNRGKVWTMVQGAKRFSAGLGREVSSRAHG